MSHSPADRVIIEPSTEEAMLELVHEFTLEVSRGESFSVGNGPFGRRGVAAIGAGRVVGERINGELVGPGADWAVLGADGYFHIDVRAQIRTDDGTVLLLTYTGALEVNDRVRAAFAGGESDFDDQYCRIHVRLESGAEHYRWVNRTLFVGQGRLTPDGIVYDIARVT